MERLVFVLSIFSCFLFSIFSGNGFNISPKIFQVNQMGPCPENNEMLMQFNITDRPLPQRNTFSLNGTIVVLEKIIAPVELRIRTQRCTSDMTHCEDFDSLSIGDVCPRMMEKNTMWTELIGRIRPKFACPFRKGTYEVSNATVDLSMVSRLPIDGYTWIIYMRYFKTKNRKKKSIFCARFEVAVTTAKGKRPYRK